MKLHNNENTLIRSGIQGEQAFSIKLNAKMYDMLSSKLYADKIGAVVRELCCNATDAHVAAGNPNPFEVILPTTLEQNFVVKDYGTGLSKEQTLELFSTLGASTKENSNDMIGALGLGSKSPFAVTDTFNIESRFNGTVYHFICFKNESGFPSALPTGEAPTDEPNGITITVPVAVGHYEAYKNAMERQLAFIHPKPIIANITGFEFVEPEKIYENEYGFILKNADAFHLTNQYDKNKTYALMGNVLYPIENTNISYEAKNGITAIKGCKVLKFSIGELDIIPSREGLSYDKQTIAAIEKAYVGYVEGFKEAIKTAYESITNPLDGYVKAKELNELMDGYSKNTGVVIDGYEINNDSSVSMPTFEVQHTVQKEDMFGDMEDHIQTLKYCLFNIGRVSKNRAGNPKYEEYFGPLQKLAFSFLLKLREGNAKIILINKEGIKNKKRKIQFAASDYMGNNQSVHVYSFSNNYTGDDYSPLVKILEYFEIDDGIIYLSEVVLPKAESIPKDKTPVMGVWKHVHEISSYGNPSYRQKSVSRMDDVGNEGFYITLNNNKPEKYSYSNFDFCDFMEKAGLTDTVYMISRTGAKNIKKIEAEGVVEFSEYIKSKLKGYKPSKDLLEILNKDSFKSYFSNRQYQYIKVYDILKERKHKVPALFTKIRNIDISDLTVLNEEDKIVYYLKTFNLIQYFKDEKWYDKVFQSLDIQKQEQELLDQYPMLKALESFGYSYKNYELFADYIQFMDGLNIESKQQELEAA